MHQNRVLFALYAHPAAFPPVERAAHILRSADWRVRIVGASGLETDALAGDALDGLEVRLVSRAGKGVAQKLQYARFLLTCLIQLVRWKPRWVYVSDSFATPFGICAALAGFRVVYHEHDSPIEEKHSRFVRAILAARGALLRRANILVTPNEGRSAVLSKAAGGREVLTAWNCPRRSEIRHQRPRLAGAGLRIVYHGSFGRDRPPLSIVEAMARVGGDIQLEIAGYETVGSRGTVARIVARAEELGIAKQVIAHPPMPRAALLERAAMCSLGLSFMPTAEPNFNERTMAGASNKAFEYLACGVPLLVSDMPDWRRMFVERGVAFVCDPADVTAASEILRYALAHPDELERMGNRGREIIEREWNYERQFGAVLRHMDRRTDAIPPVFQAPQPTS